MMTPPYWGQSSRGVLVGGGWGSSSLLADYNVNKPGDDTIIETHDKRVMCHHLYLEINKAKYNLVKH